MMTELVKRAKTQKHVRLLVVEMDFDSRACATKVLSSVAMTCPSCGGQVKPNVAHRCRQVKGTKS